MKKKTGHLRHGSGIRMYNSVKSWRLYVCVCNIRTTNRTGRDSCSYTTQQQSTAELDFVIRLFLSIGFFLWECVCVCVCGRGRNLCYVERRQSVVADSSFLFMLEDRFAFIASRLTHFSRLENVQSFPRKKNI